MGIFKLQPDGPATHYQMIVTPDLCVGGPDRPFLFGGTMLGAAITAMERCAERPVIWATAQFLSHASPGSILDVAVTLASVGRQTTQAQAVGQVDGRTTVVVSAALGETTHHMEGQWVRAPHVCAPDQSPDDFAWPSTALMLKQAIEIRHALPAKAVSLGRMMLWIRARQDIPMDAALLATIADFTTAAIPEVFGMGYIGNSLDNTIRLGRIVACSWILCDIQIQGALAGFAHGEMRLYAQTGELLAIASQSMILRPAVAAGGHSQYATSSPGIFAVGDVRAGSIKRVASSVGEGSVVISSVWEFLQR
jgi:acyl-CoA thioesterase-2